MSAQDRLPVVVAVDGSRTGLATVDLAAAEAVRRGASLVIVHVWPGRYTGPFQPRRPAPGEADGRHLLDVVARRAALGAPKLQIATELLDGGVANAIARRSEQASLIVVGHRDEITTRRSWGSTTAYLAHHSSCPLLVHRGAISQQVPVVVAVSARPTATATIGYAYAEAALRDARPMAVHVWTRTARDGGSPAAVTSDYTLERRNAERALAEALAGWSWEFPDVSVDRVVVHDLDIAYTIERASRRGRLLVAGMARNGRFAELLYGSHSTAMVRQLPCPVLLVPPAWQTRAGVAAQRDPAAPEAL